MNQFPKWLYWLAKGSAITLALCAGGTLVVGLVYSFLNPWPYKADVYEPLSLKAVGIAINEYLREHNGHMPWMFSGNDLIEQLRENSKGRKDFAKVNEDEYDIQINRGLSRRPIQSLSARDYVCIAYYVNGPVKVYALYGRRHRSQLEYEVRRERIDSVRKACGI